MKQATIYSNQIRARRRCYEKDKRFVLSREVRNHREASRLLTRHLLGLDPSETSRLDPFTAAPGSGLIFLKRLI